jgi:hypothetical protein
MEPNLIVLAVAVWFLVSLLGRGSRRTPTPPRQPRHPQQRPLGQARSPDPTHRAGGRVEVMLREFQRALEEGRQVRQDAALESGSEARRLEGEVGRVRREELDQDDQAEQIVSRRINAAAARGQGREAKKGSRAEAPVQAEPADHTATPRYTTQQLRDAVVWREILGPPVSER